MVVSWYYYLTTEVVSILGRWRPTNKNIVWVIGSDFFTISRSKNWEAVKSFLPSKIFSKKRNYYKLRTNQNPSDPLLPIFLKMCLPDSFNIGRPLLYSQHILLYYNIDFNSYLLINNLWTESLYTLIYIYSFCNLWYWINWLSPIYHNV